MMRFRMFESERERRPGADEMACIGTPPLTPVRRLCKETCQTKEDGKKRAAEGERLT
jgi:hypothetical protein